MTLEMIAGFVAGLCLLIGSFFVLVGAIGLLKFNDSMCRLHAPTKVGTVGIGMMLLASMLNAIAAGTGSMHELLIMAFLFVTAPVSANFIAKVNIHRRSCETPPPPLEDDTWSTLNSPEAEQP
ncbi:MAG: monovalent cation/H(+) antiporter subunit G [Silicimonas sp.]|jgi:multicomponent K+:H+ antiporter subunit G|nr:monovalent cation/H(+) antiporter subunit G [Silicimonas sp.]